MPCSTSFTILVNAIMFKDYSSSVSDIASTICGFIIELFVMLQCCIVLEIRDPLEKRTIARYWSWPFQPPEAQEYVDLVSELNNIVSAIQVLLVRIVRSLRGLSFLEVLLGITSIRKVEPYMHSLLYDILSKWVFEASKSKSKLHSGSTRSCTRETLDSVADEQTNNHGSSHDGNQSLSGLNQLEQNPSISPFLSRRIDKRGDELKESNCKGQVDYVLPSSEEEVEPSKLSESLSITEEEDFPICLE
ncbi:hypothetical protein IFM89_016020, partial [Coptis chinensis]